MAKLFIAFIVTISTYQQAAAYDIYWTDKDVVQIWNAEDNGTNQQLLYDSSDGLTDPRGLQINFATGDLYVADHSSSNGKIYRGSLDGLSALTSVISGLSDPADMLIDWDNSKIYWAEQSGGAIRRADLNGTNQETLFSGITGVNAPYYLALDSAAGNLYWSDFNSGTIHRADITVATPVATNLITGLDRVRDIELDLVNQKIYWADRDDSIIVRRNLDGSGSNEVLFTATDGLDRPHGIALDLKHDKIFWTDTETTDVLFGNINGTGSPTTIDFGGSQNGPWQIIVPEPSSVLLTIIGLLGLICFCRKNKKA